MSYELALEAAGAKILAFDQFGSYQGDWLAQVEYEGKMFLVSGSYGSCSGCDAFEGEFCFDQREECEEHRYIYPKVTGCAECAEMAAIYQKRLAAFGRGYLDDPRSKKQLMEQFTRQSEWDSDAPEILQWLSERSEL